MKSHTNRLKSSEGGAGLSTMATAICSLFILLILSDILDVGHANGLEQKKGGLSLTSGVGTVVSEGVVMCRLQLNATEMELEGSGGNGQDLPMARTFLQSGRTPSSSSLFSAQQQEGKGSSGGLPILRAALMADLIEIVKKATHSSSSSSLSVDVRDVYLHGLYRHVVVITFAVLVPTDDEASGGDGGGGGADPQSTAATRRSSRDIGLASDVSAKDRDAVRRAFLGDTSHERTTSYLFPRLTQELEKNMQQQEGTERALLLHNVVAFDLCPLLTGSQEAEGDATSILDLDEAIGVTTASRAARWQRYWVGHALAPSRNTLERLRGFNLPAASSGRWNSAFALLSVVVLSAIFF